MTDSYTYNIVGEFVSWQVFDVLVFGVNDICKFSVVDHLFVDVHVDIFFKFWIVVDVYANDLGNC